MGIWDVHYQEVYAVDSHILKGASNSNSLGLLNNFGTSALPTIGARYSNVIRYQSPSWSGFNVRVAYVRPTDVIPPNAAGTISDDKKNRAWNFVPNYSSGPLYLAWSHLDDKDIILGAGTGPLAGILPAAVAKVTSDRFFAAYTLPMGFKVGFVYDRSKLRADTATGSGDIKRDVWAIPLSYTTGPHAVFFNYAKAKSWKGSAVDGSAPVVIGTTSTSLTGDTGARMISLGYQYELSKRTNIHLTYAQIRNDAAAQYDFFSAPVGTGVAAAGADPRVYSIGLRHAF
jgi:predicted porin